MSVRADRGFHSILEYDHPYVFVDGCMQIWPDAELDTAHRHGVTTYAVTAMHTQATLPQALKQLMYWHLVARQHDNIFVVDTAEDVSRAKRERKASLLLAAQGADFVRDEVHRIEAFYRLGLRLMAPAYNAANRICGGCLDRADGGLTRFGQLVVKECNRVGLLLDCSHVGSRSALDIIEHSLAPVVFSHSNPDGVVDNPRNISDEAIKACASGGGVIGLVAWGPLVRKSGQTSWPTVVDFVDHVDYVAQLLGSTNSIGISTDLSLGTYPDRRSDPWGEPDYPNFHLEYDRLIASDVRSPKRALEGFNDYSQVVNVIEELGSRGYSEEDVSKILGLNFQRVFGKVWR